MIAVGCVKSLNSAFFVLMGCLATDQNGRNAHGRTCDSARLGIGGVQVNSSLEKKQNSRFLGKIRLRGVTLGNQVTQRLRSERAKSKEMKKEDDLSLLGKSPLESPWDPLIWMRVEFSIQPPCKAALVSRDITGLLNTTRPIRVAPSVSCHGDGVCVESPRARSLPHGRSHAPTRLCLCVD